MAICRVHKTKDYTLMSNYHLRDMELSCKACGLLSKMLSLPDEWDFTTRGLVAICKDGEACIRSALKELEMRGYLVRRRVRDDKGRIADVEYNIYETPHSPVEDDPYVENQHVDNPSEETPSVENRAQLNTKESSINKSITNESNTKSFVPSVSDDLRSLSHVDRMTDGRIARDAIRDRIDYAFLASHVDQCQLDELVEIMVEVELNTSPFVRIGRDGKFPMDYVRQRFRKLDASHIERVMEGIRRNTTCVLNTKLYLMTALFNAVATIDNHYAMEVNHDLSGV